MSNPVEDGLRGAGTGNPKEVVLPHELRTTATSKSLAYSCESATVTTCVLGGQAVGGVESDENGRPLQKHLFSERLHSYFSVLI